MEMTTPGRASLAAVPTRYSLTPVAPSVGGDALSQKGWVAETFPPTGVGSTVDDYMNLHGPCGCPKPAGSAVAWTDPESSCIFASQCALRPNERSPDVRYGRKVAMHPFRGADASRLRSRARATPLRLDRPRETRPVAPPEPTGNVFLASR